jgi:DNA-binding transcriptional LysR family regulator
VRIDSGNSLDLVGRLRAFEIDVAVVAQPPPGEDLVSQLLRRDPMVLVMACGMAPSTTSPLPLASLSHTPLVLREDGSATRAITLALLQRHGVRPARVLAVNGRETCLEAVAQGLGATIVSAGELTADTRLAVFDIADESLLMEEHLVYLRTRRNLRVIRAFLASVAAGQGASQHY